MIVEKYQNIGTWMWRTTIVVAILLILLLSLVDTMNVDELWVDILFITELAVSAIVALATLLLLILFVRQAILKKIGFKDTLVTCLLFLVNVPISLVSLFVFFMILLGISGLPGQD